MKSIITESPVSAVVASLSARADGKVTDTDVAEAGVSLNPAQARLRAADHTEPRRTFSDPLMVEAHRSGWTAGSMKNDWNTIFSK
jgi:hypothetical protein